MSLETFLSKIGHFFTNLLNLAAQAFNAFEPATQAAIKQASGIVAIVNANLTAAPADVWALITKEFPTLTESGVAAALNTVLKSLNTTSETLAPDIETTLENLQKYLASFSGNAFITIVKAVVALLATLFDPNETLIQKIELVLEYVYQNFVKGKV